jgi:hypothetical protein
MIKMSANSNALALLAQAESRIDLKIDPRLSDFLKRKVNVGNLVAVEGEIVVCEEGADEQSLIVEVRRSLRTANRIRTNIDEEKYSEVIQIASPIISSFLKRQGPIIVGPLAPLFNICLGRSRAHFILKRFDLAIDDATMGLHMISRCAEALQYSKRTGLSEERLRFNIFKALYCKARVLTTRSRSTQLQGDLCGALIDARASHALSKSLEPTEDTFHQLEMSLHLIVSILAEMKCGMPRPHYTPHENREWCKELRIGDYSLKNRVCSNCGQCPASSVRLLKCGGCRRTWFCGKTCHQESWPKHKERCHQLRLAAHHVRVEMTESEVRESLEIGGHGFIDNIHDTLILLRDTRTGEVFDSLSNRTVCFLPESD